MATPRVFVSSTYYDLKYIRENLKYFIRTIGYEPTLSEEGDVFYNPKKHTHDACISEVPSCQIFVLIIGGRFGGKFKDTDKSITNNEYLEAVKQKIPVFALVETSVFAEHQIYNENLKVGGKTKADSISYPSTSNPKVFEFIDEVRQNAINNAIVPFKDFSDIESYLKKQWAGMMFTFLASESEENRVADTLSALTLMSQKIELLSKQILSSVGSAKAILTIKLYEVIISFECFRDLTFIGIKPTPQDILKYPDIVKLGQAYKKEIKAYEKDEEDEDGQYSLTSSGSMGAERFEYNKEEYLKLRNELLRLISESGLTLEDYLKE